MDYLFDGTTQKALEDIQSSKAFSFQNILNRFRHSLGRNPSVTTATHRRAALISTRATQLLLSQSNPITTDDFLDICLTIHARVFQILHCSLLCYQEFQLM